MTPERVRKLRHGDEGKKIYKELDAIIIDEISMVRADLLDCVDKFLRLNGPLENKPFGGIQMIFIGDLYQLSPVVTGADKEIFKHFIKRPIFTAPMCLNFSKWNLWNYRKSTDSTT